MSYDEQDAARDEFIERLSNELYPEHRDQAVTEFTQECLQRFYRANRDSLLRPLNLLREAQWLAEDHRAAALVFAFASMEILLKSALLTPIVAGLVHTDTLAKPLVEFLLGRLTGWDRLKILLFPIVKEHAGIDLSSFKRTGSSQTLWAEIKSVEKARNKILHSGDVSDEQLFTLAIALAEFTLDDLFTSVLDYVQLHLHDDQICDVPGTKICPDRARPSIPLKPPAPSADLSEFRHYLHSQEPSIAGLLSLGKETQLQFESDKLIITSRYDFALKDRKELLERIASELYRRPIAVEFRN